MARRPDTPLVLRFLMALVRGFAYVLSRPTRREHRHRAVRGRRERIADCAPAPKYDVQARDAHEVADGGRPPDHQQAGAEARTPQEPATRSQDSAQALAILSEPDVAEVYDTAAAGQIGELTDIETEPSSPKAPDVVVEIPDPTTHPVPGPDDGDEPEPSPTITRSADDLLREYVAKFRGLHRSVNARVWAADTLHMSPHKPILLLAVLSLVADGTITNNVVTFDEPLLSRFDAFWRRLMGDGRSVRAFYPLFYLKSEGFWHLQPIMSSESTHGRREVYSLAELLGRFSGACLDEELFALLQDAAARAVLWDALLHAHFTEEAASRLTDVPDAGLPAEGLAGGEHISSTRDEDVAPNRRCGTGAPEPSTEDSAEPSPGNCDQADSKASIAEGDALAPAEMADGVSVVGTDPGVPATETGEANAFLEDGDVSDHPWHEGASDCEAAAEEGVAPPAEPASMPERGAATVDEDQGTPPQCTIHVEVFVASRVLAGRNPTFSRQELVQAIRSLFGDTRSGVVSYVRSSRCVANRSFDSRYAFNYLWELDSRLLRCFRPGEDQPLARRRALPEQPDLRDIPEQYRSLLQDIVTRPLAEVPHGPREAYDDAAPKGPQTLGGWERHLGPRMSGLGMVFELDLGEEDTEAIGALIRDSIRRRGPTKTLDQLERDTPATLVCYLTFAGVYGYNRGNYWASVCRATSLPYVGAHTSDWGFRYLNVCERLGLRIEIDRDSYVDLILFQAGIPRSCLPPFFEHMLLPSVSRPELSALETTQVIEHWLTSSVHYFVPKPVLRFLEYGGTVVEAYVGEFRAIAAAALQGTRSAACVTLPAYALDAFEEWSASHGSRAKEPPGGRAERFVAPNIRLDPWGGGPFLRLAPQSLLASRPGQAVWRVSTGGEVRTYATHARSSEGSLLTEETTVPLPPPRSTIVASLQVGDSLLRSWECPMPRLDAGYMVFDPASGNLAEDPERMHAEKWWLFLAPNTQATVSPEDTHYLCETFPSCGGGWDGWRAHEIDVSSVSQVIIQNGAVTTRLRPGRDRREPRLVGGRRAELPPLSCPLYVGLPPLVRLPVVDESSGGTSDWGVTISSVGRAIPACNQRLSVRSSADGCHGHSSEGVHELALGDDRILGKRAFGEYIIDCESGDGRRTSLRFRIVPQLEFSAPTSIVLPEAAYLQPIVVTIAVDAPTEVVTVEASQVRESTFETTATERRYRFTVEADVTTLRLQLRRREGGRAVEIGVSVPVPRLRWRLATVPNAGYRWGQRSLCTSLDEFDQSEAPALLVDAPRLPVGSLVRVAVVSHDGEVVQELEPDSLGSDSRLFRYDLRLVRDTLRRLEGLDVTLGLRLDRCGEGTLANITIARVTEHPLLAHLALRRDAQDPERHLRAEWAPNPPIRNRVLRLCSFIRPWEETLSLAIPDDARHATEWRLDQPSPPDGYYHAEMVSEDPWVAADPEPPSAGSPHLVDLELGDAAVRYSELLALIEAGTANHADVGECLLLAKHYGDHDQIEPLLDWLYRGVETCSLAILVPIAAAFPDSPGARAIRPRIYTPGRIRQVVRACGMGEWDPARLGAYLALRPPLNDLTTEAIEALLDVEDRTVSLEAAQTLVERDEQSGYEAIIRQLTVGEIGMDDAIDILLTDPEVSIRYLCTRLNGARTLSLLEALQEVHPEHIQRIRPGYWVHCRMGWGLIRGIKAPSGEPIPAAFADDLSEGVLLDVIVRPAADAIPVIVDVAGRTVRIPGRCRALWECTKCSSFASADADLLRGQHNRAAHGGLSPAMRPLPERNGIPLGRELGFSVSEPKSMWT